MTQSTLVPGLVMTAVGGAALAYSLFLGQWRRWRMRRMQKASGAAMEQVESWFRPTHGWLSDLLQRGGTFSIGMTLVIIGLGEAAGDALRPVFGSDLTMVGTIVGYAIGLSVLAAPLCAALFFFLCAERLAGYYILLELRNNRYDYPAAELETRKLLRAGPFFSVFARVTGLVILGIAWFVGSGITANLVPQLHTWLGK